MNEINTELQTRIENLDGRGSGLVFKKIMSMQIEAYETNFFSGWTYRELPIVNHAVLKIEKFDLFCALWSILAKMFP